MAKNGNFIFVDLLHQSSIPGIVPLGISFYSLQIIGYLVDIYNKKINPQKNFLKYALFISYFPQIIQGPIPRYEQLQTQLIEGHKFKEDVFIRGFCYIIWGFFLKLVIADKAAVIVNAVFNNYPAYSGVYIWVASFLYSIQLYTDFLACTMLAQGVSRLFGIELVDNFKRPYFATSIKEFWKRWHISLSDWLRDYIYIPLGGNQRGRLHKYLNLIITFLISGIWHGVGIKFLVWGAIHAVYQIAGELLSKPKEKIYQLFQVSIDSKWKRRIKQVGMFMLVNWAWIIFRADTLGLGLRLIKHMFCEFNPWVLFNDRLFTLGLGWKEVLVLIFAIILLWQVEKRQEDGIIISEKIMCQCLPLRWLIYILGIVSIIIFGTYGFGFDAQDFIYGGF